MTTVLESLNASLHRALTDDERVIVLGEDLLDPYGGAFKVTRGLSQAYPGRVLTTPLSEAGFVGVAAGMALRGMRPVVEIMFGDFLTLAADQLINHATKFGWMYSGGKPAAEQVKVPMVVRTPMGGRRGYGPTHSQTLEKHFLGVPGLRVLAPCSLGDPGELLYQAVLKTEGPVLFIENKLLYLLPVIDTQNEDEFDIQEISQCLAAPGFVMKLRGAPPPGLTLATYGYMTELARQAAHQLAYEHEVFIEILVLTQLAPFEIEPVLESAGQTSRLLTLEEGPLSLGWGAEIVARTVEGLGGHLQSAHRLAALDLPVPSSPALETAILPQTGHIVDTCLKIMQKR